MQRAARAPAQPRTPARPESPRRSAAGACRCDVLVRAEHVVGVVSRLDLGQALVIPAVRGADPRFALVVVQEVDVHPAGPMRGEGGRVLTTPGDVRVLGSALG